MAEMTTKEFWARTGITEGYGAEILKDAEHAAWHMPQGAKWANEAVVEPTADDSDVDDPTDDTGAGEGTDNGDGPDLDEGGSVEGEPEE
jgi:hypothetical protein